jgi:TPR repeat protein
MEVQKSFSLANFAKVQELGLGKQTRTSLYRENETGAVYVVKEFAIPDSLMAAFEKEVALIQSPSRPSVILVLGWSAPDRAAFFPHFRRGSVASNGDRLTVFQKIKVILGVADAMAYLYGRGLTHGNLKFENVLLNDSLEPIVDGFGFATFLEQAPVYPAPEFPCDICEPVDVYAFGRFCLHLMTGLPETELPSSFHAKFRGLIASCISPKPPSRPTFAAIRDQLGPEILPIPPGQITEFRVYADFLANPAARLPPLTIHGCQSTSSLTMEQNDAPPLSRHNSAGLPALQPLETGMERHYDIGMNAIRSGMYDVAFSHFQIAARLGHHDAHCRLGLLYLTGVGVSKDEARALDHLRLAAQHRHPEAEFLLAEVLLNEDSEHRSRSHGLKHLRRAANLGHPAAQYRFGKYLADGADGVNRDPAIAVRFLARAAKAGIADAQYEAGKMFYEGIGTRQKLVKAVDLFEQCAARKHPTGLAAFGLMLELGYKLPQDNARATELYKESADLGNAFGQNAYARALASGLGVERDFAKAAEYFRRAAAQGYAAAMNNYGRLLERGLGVSRNYAEAVRYYQMAVDRGEVVALVNLGLMYEAGWGVSKDVERAVLFFRQAAEQEAPDGQFHYGRMIERGNGVKNDIGECLRLYRLAANQGCARAQYNLARLLQEGAGGEPDPDDALRYYTRAAQQGHVKARQALERIEQAKQPPGFCAPKK